MKSTKRQEQKANTRRKILEAAYRVYAEKGFAAATSEIAKEAGLAHGSLFVHFPTLHDLLICLLGDFGEIIGVRLHTLAEKKEALYDLLGAHIDTLQEYESFYVRLITELSLLPEDARHTYASIQSAVAVHFNEVMQEELRGGQIVQRVPLHMMFNTWMGLVHYYLMNKAFFAPEGSVLQRYRADLINTYVNIIKGGR